MLVDLAMEQGLYVATGFIDRVSGLSLTNLLLTLALLVRATKTSINTAVVAAAASTAVTTNKSDSTESSAATTTMTSAFPPTQVDADSPTLFELEPSDCETLLSRSFLYKMVRDNVHPQAVSQLFVHFGWENLRWSRHLVGVISDGLSRATADSFGSWFELMQSFLALSDSLQEWRVDALMCCQLPIIESNITKRATIDTYVKHLEQLARNEKVHIWCNRNHHALEKLFSEAGYYIVSNS
jgi:hypothetical protein